MARQAGCEVIYNHLRTHESLQNGSESQHSPLHEQSSDHCSKLRCLGESPSRSSPQRLAIRPTTISISCLRKNDDQEVIDSYYRWVYIIAISIRTSSGSANSSAANAPSTVKEKAPAEKDVWKFLVLSIEMIDLK